MIDALPDLDVSPCSVGLVVCFPGSELVSDWSTLHIGSPNVVPEEDWVSWVVSGWEFGIGPCCVISIPVLPLPPLIPSLFMLSPEASAALDVLVFISFQLIC